jgi:hypothetical protein
MLSCIAFATMVLMLETIVIGVVSFNYLLVNLIVFTAPINAAFFDNLSKKGITAPYREW